jgi:predicted DNA repair protein MutK
MASGFFALLDDISVLMDDVVVMSKISAKKTAGILGDDLAVNAEKASGFVSSRELPVLWAITKGSFFNKLIILPFAFLLSTFLPSLITIILILGGFYLAYEGVEKIFEYITRHKTTVSKMSSKLTSETEVLTLEKKKIKSAILTDFILSVEIIIIALGTVMDQSLTIQIAVVSIISIIATVGVYGLVALIVRMDDFGLKLIQMSNGKKNSVQFIGVTLVNALPLVIKSLSVVGTLALLLVSGGIFVHNIEAFHHILESFPGILRDFTFGLAAGIGVLLVVKLIKWGLKF